MRQLIKNARLFDGEKIWDGQHSVLIDGGIIARIAPEITADSECAVTDAMGKILSPGFIDLHCHMRDPGQEWREDMSSGSMAGAAGGFTLLVAMPNTSPAVDTPALVRYVVDKGGSQAGARILPSACVSHERKGESLTELTALAKEGAVLFTDDGAPVSNSRLLRFAMLTCGKEYPLIMEHPEEPALFKGGHVHEGVISTLSGIEGIPSSGEEIGVMRGIALARETGGRIHFTHLSSAIAVEQVRRAKKDGLAVTCDVTPQHLTLTEMDVWESGCDARFKVNPPLRSVADRDALWKGLADGTIDAIITDHAPWHTDDKDVPLQEAPFGIACLECAFAAVWNYRQKHHKDIPEALLLQKLTSSPASLLPAPWNKRGRVVEGAPADLVLIDPGLEDTVDCSTWQSKVRLTAWEGQVLVGWPVMTLRDGQVVWKRGA